MAKGFENEKSAKVQKSKPKKAKKGKKKISEIVEENEDDNVFRIAKESKFVPDREINEGDIRSDDEISKKMGVQSADKKRRYIPDAQITMEQRKESNFNVLDSIPTEMQGNIEKFLSLGAAVCLLFFISCGISLGFEAYAVASKNPMPKNIDNIVVNYLEPAFTPSLFVLLAFSSLLGVFKVSQLGKSGVNYKE
eukprot:CAMPEP_0171462890 /NCGR_PEP_ID=MMETSP0945-20130129/6760_1 /TAXON_ID=109269 /ORGANISM="Vaucheria litorea, Strain CCMP2940" /LENGTH=193 /DNA_ID=CAMNT_0011989533 /DNA_START=108 /DNA_END=689 /DNA_ORIENTATION=+